MTLTKIIFVTFISLVGMYYLFYIESVHTNLLHSISSFFLKKHKKPRCSKWYLDIGTNIGVQIRKLYEPQKYPDAAVRSLFHDHLHVNDLKSDLCVLGIEMNPSHSEKLQNLSNYYRKTCGYQVTILTETAAANHDGTIAFKSDLAFSHHEWGSSTVAQQNTGPETIVNAIHLASYIKKYVLSTSPHYIMMKMDIEGSEQSVLSSLLASGILCQHIDLVMIEYHPAFAKIDFLQNSVQDILAFGGCKTQIMALDDETYIHDVDHHVQCQT